jgi:DNA processing protein
MIKTLEFKLNELNDMRKYPNDIFYIGNTSLLQKKKISIVGSRKPNQYAIQKTHEIASKLSNNGICIVSGGAMGIDTVAHKASGTHNTIMVAGTGLDIRYPTINKKMILEIEKDGLVISLFDKNISSIPRNFAIRNELIVALGDILIVAYADLKSGTMRSVEYAQKMGKEIYVLPHRIDESKGTNRLLENGLATPIYDIDTFIEKFNSHSITTTDNTKDELLNFCKNNPTYDEAFSKFGILIFEYELSGKIIINNGTISLT